MGTALAEYDARIVETIVEMRIDDTGESETIRTTYVVSAPDGYAFGAAVGSLYFSGIKLDKNTSFQSDGSPDEVYDGIEDHPTGGKL
jgi:hypothetical protein